jgi:uncharacterized protein YfaS (alpha-2-macroglobulin family)
MALGAVVFLLLLGGVAAAVSRSLGHKPGVDQVFAGTGVPRLSTHLPGSGATAIPKDGRLVLVFDRPIVPLAQVQGSNGAKPKEWPVTIAPATEGRWRWLSTFTAEFVPKNGLTLATAYTVSVPAGIPTMSGEKTEKDASFVFETLRPAVIASEPENGYAFAGPSTTLSLTFSQPMDLKAAKDALILTRATGTGAKQKVQNEDESRKKGIDMGTIDPKVFETSTGSSIAGTTVPIKEIRYGTTRTADGKTVTDPATLLVIPSTPLVYSSAYELRVRAGIRGAEGTLGSAKDAALRFSTVGPLSVGNAQYQYGSITLNFSNPLGSGSLKSVISLKPQPENWNDLEIEPNIWGDQRDVSFYPALKPSTSYTLTVSKGMKDAFGQTLKEPYTFTFKTDPLDPNVSIKSNGRFGIFERGKAPVYYVDSVNVSRLDLTVAPLTLDQFLGFQQQLQDVPMFHPDLSSLQGSKSWSVKTANKLNDWEVSSFDVEKTLGSTLAPGLYALTARAPEFIARYGNPEPIVLTQYFTITDIALTLKYSGDHALVWATDMRTGVPVADASVAFHAQGGAIPVTGRTDAQGFFEAPVRMADFTTRQEWQPVFTVTAEKDGDFAFVRSDWDEGINAWDFALSSDFHGTNSPTNRLVSYLYTERPIYAAGDTVFFKGIVRLRDWEGMTKVPSPSTTASVTVQDEQQRVVYNKTLPLSTLGSFSDSFPLDKAASLGSYSLTASLSPDSETSDRSAYASFRVLAYRKPEYKIDLTPSATDLLNGQTASFDVAAAYYFGAPMAGAKMQWSAQETDYYFNRYTDGWYSFATEDLWCWENCDRQTKQLTQGNGVLDSAGRATISFPVNIDDRDRSQIVSVEATVTDPNNQTVSNGASAYVHKSGVYVGVRTSDYVLTPGQTAHADVIAVKPDGTPVAGQSVTVRLYSRVWNTVRKKGVDGQYYYDNTPKDTFIRETDVTTGKDGKAQASLLADKGGQMEIVAVAKDAGGRETKAGTSIYVFSDTFVNWPHANNDRIAVETDKPEYKVGDTALLLVKSPYQGQGVKALVTVERENVFRKQVVDITSSAQPIKIEVTKDMLPNAFVSVVILKPRQGETFDDQGKDTGAPAFKMGYAELNIETSAKELSVDVATDKESYLPGETVRVTLSAKDSTGKPARAELSLGVVDMSLLALAGFEKPDLIQAFWSKQGLGVINSVSLLHLLERFKPGSKGGGGGDFESQARGTFKDTAYWNPSILTDASGKATVSFKLPDNLTTWKLLAIAHTKDTNVGVGIKDIVETKTVLVRPVLPRFAVRGDMIDVGAIVHNQRTADGTFTVTLRGSGFVSAGQPSQRVTIAKGEMKKVLFPVKVGTGSSASFTMRAETDGARDEIVQSIPVHVFGTPQAVTTSGIADGDVTEQVLAPTKKDAENGDVTITVSPTIATYLPGGLTYLIDYPYGCAEQTVSAFLPSVALRSLQKYDAFRIVSDARLTSIVTQSLQKLYGFQRADGGFGYWTESDRSDPFLTGYVVYALQLTEQADYAVDQSVLDRARTYLQGALRAENLKDPLNLSERSFLLFVLAEGKRPDIAALSNLYDLRTNLPVFAKAYLAMGLQKSGNGSLQGKAKKVLGEIMNTAKVDPRGTHFEEKENSRYASLLSTNNRTTALALQAIIRIDPKNEFAPNVVRYLLAARTDGHWDTTQSTAVSLLALRDYLQSTGEMEASALNTTVTVNGKSVLQQTFGKDNILSRKEVSLAFDTLKRGALNDVVIDRQGTGRIYYDILLSYFFTPDALEPMEQGMAITRTVTPLGAADDTPSVTKASLGDTYRVTLTMTLPEDRNFVAVESPLPAGMEAIDFSLRTSQQGLQEKLKGANTDWWKDDPWSLARRLFTHIEYRDDRVFLFAEHLPAGVYSYDYLVRATTPGTFHDRPARIFEMYMPETFGQTGGSWFTVSE